MIQSNKPPFDDSLVEKLQRWLIQYGQYILYAFGIALLIIFASSHFFSTDSRTATESFIQTDRSFTAFSNPTTQSLYPEKWDESFAELQQGIAAHPELQQKYDAPIAQVLLTKGFVQDATPFAHQSFLRIEADDLPFYPSFAKTSLLIGKKEYKTALAQAEELYNAMTQSLQNTDTSSYPLPFGPYLFLANLLRIASLYHILDNAEGEKAAWERLSKEMGKKTTETFFRSFEIGKVSLPNYVEYRLQQLNG